MTYHPDVLHGSQAPVENTEPKASTTFDEVSKCQVILIHTLTLLPDQSANVPVQGNRAQGTLFLESELSESDLIVEDGLLEFSQSGRSGLAIANTSDHTCHVRRGTVMGSLMSGDCRGVPSDGYQASVIRRVYTKEVGTRRQLLADLLKGQDMALDDTQRQLLVSTLTDLHGAFACRRESGVRQS